jgi:hypothetical protein
MGKASTAWLNSILGVDGFGKISRSRLWPQPVNYFARVYLFCATAPPPTEPLAFSLINSSALSTTILRGCTAPSQLGNVLALTVKMTSFLSSSTV